MTDQAAAVKAQQNEAFVKQSLIATARKFYDQLMGYMHGIPMDQEQMKPAYTMLAHGFLWFKDIVEFGKLELGQPTPQAPTLEVVKDVTPPVEDTDVTSDTNGQDAAPQATEENVIPECKL